MQQLKEVFQRSTVHGLAHAANAHSRLGEAFWATLCLGGLVAFLYNVSFTLRHYHSLPLLTSYFSNAEAMDWPDFTFCNQVPVSLSDPQQFSRWQAALAKASAFENSTHMFQFFRLFREPEDLQLNPGISQEDRLLVNLTLALSTLNLMDVDELKRSLVKVGYNKGQRSIALNVQFDNNIEQLPLDSQHVTTTTWFGRYRTACLTLQVKRMFNGSDAADKLRAMFFFILNDFHSYMLFNSAYFHQGTRFYMHDPDTVPSGEGILIVPGHSQKINFKAVVTHLLKKKRNCREAEEFVEMYDASLQSARRVKLDFGLCKLRASVLQYHAACGCYSPFLPVFKFDNSTPSLCFNMSVFNARQLQRNARCLAKVFNTFSSERLFQNIVASECRHVSRSLCVQTDYNVESSDYMWPEVWSEDMNSARLDMMRSIAGLILHRKSPNLTEAQAYEEAHSRMSVQQVSRLLRTDCSDVHIRARSVFADKVEETEEYPFSQLVSDIGGLLGLYLGLSIVGLFETVEMAQAFCLGLCKLAKMRWLMREYRTVSGGQRAGAGVACNGTAHGRRRRCRWSYRSPILPPPTTGILRPQRCLSRECVLSPTGQ